MAAVPGLCSHELQGGVLFLESKQWTYLVNGILGNEKRILHASHGGKG